MNKLIFLLLPLFVSLLPIGVMGQTPLSESQQKQVMDKINKTAQQVHTMQCHFVQNKSMTMMKRDITSQGLMYFRKPNELRWQYTSPYDYSFIMHNGKAYMKSSKTTTVVDVNKNKMFRQISDMIMTCMIGGNLGKSSYFKVNLFKSGNETYANLTPLKKELKQVYSLVTIHFNSQLTMVNKVEMTEKNGDKTIISLTNIRINERIDDKMFSND